MECVNDTGVGVDVLPRGVLQGLVGVGLGGSCLGSLGEQSVQVVKVMQD
jgi:hypothetical protein